MDFLRNLSKEDIKKSVLLNICANAHGETLETSGLRRTTMCGCTCTGNCGCTCTCTCTCTCAHTCGGTRWN